MNRGYSDPFALKQDVVPEKQGQVDVVGDLERELRS